MEECIFRALIRFLKNKRIPYFKFCERNWVLLDFSATLFLINKAALSCNFKN